MTKLTPINRNDFVKKLRAFGFEGPYSGGKHSFMIKGSCRFSRSKAKTFGVYDHLAIVSRQYPS